MAPESEGTPPKPAAIDGEKQFTVSLLRGSIVLMRHLLSASGWATKPVHIRRGKRLRAALPKLEVPKDADEAWDGEAADPVEIPESLRKTGAACLSHFLEKGALGATDSIEVLLTEFGVVAEE